MLLDSLSLPPMGGWLAGGILVGLLASFWSTIKAWMLRATRLLVCRADIVDSQVISSVIRELQSNGRVLSGGRRVISAKSLTDARTGRSIRLVGDVLGAESRLIWYRRGVVVLSRRNATNGMGSHANDSDSVPWDGGTTFVSLRWLRWTLDFDGLLLRSTEDWRASSSQKLTVPGQNDIINRGRPRLVTGGLPDVPDTYGRGYGVYTHVGTLGRAITLSARQESGAGALVGPATPSDDLRFSDFMPLAFDVANIGDPVPKDPSSSLALTSTVKAVLDDCRKWLQSRDFCEARGLAWRRGYLLHGRPGSGKSTAVRLLAQMFRLPVHRLFLGTMRTTEFLEVWERVLADGPCVVLMEDFDAVFHGRVNVIDPEAGVSFDVLLNEIAGVKVSNGVLLVVTTNHLEHLDEALGVPRRADMPVSETTRPGRIDRAFQFPLPSDTERVELARKLLDGLFSDEEICQLAAEGAGVSMTQFHQCLCDLAHRAYWEQCEKG